MKASIFPSITTIAGRILKRIDIRRIGIHEAYIGTIIIRRIGIGQMVLAPKTD